MTTENRRINGNGPWYAGLARQLLGQGIGAVIALALLIGTYQLIREFLPPTISALGRTATAIESVAESTQESQQLLESIAKDNAAQTTAQEQVLDIITTDPEDREAVRNRIKAERRGR